MRLELDPASPVPLYRQLVDAIRGQLRLGVLQPGDRLPTVRELAVLGRVNRNTAARAIQMLEADGLVHTRVGRGTFVAERAAQLDGAVRERALTELVRRTLAEARTLGASAVELSKRLQDAEAESPGSEGGEERDD